MRAFLARAAAVGALLLAVPAAGALLLAVPAAGALLLAAPGSALAKAPPRAQVTLRTALVKDLRVAAAAAGVDVFDLTTGSTLFATRARVPRMPASVEKLYTTSTALLRFGPSATLTTSVLGVGTMDANNVWHGTLYLKGGGDPTFGSASFDRFAYGTGATVQELVSNLISATGITGVDGQIVGDESFLDSERGTQATGGAASAYVEGVLSGLAFDRGLANEQGTAFQTHPALFATQQFVAALRAAGLDVPKNTPVSTGVTPATADLMASVHSPQISTLIRLTNAPSDNYLAEMLLKDVGASYGTAGSTAAGAAVVRAQMQQSFGIKPALNDGSGLSRGDRTTARDVITLLQAMATNRDFVNSLSIAGKTGTLQSGLQRTAAEGRCRGKTGTLHDVANEVGYCTARDGHTLAFAFLLNSVDPTLGHSLEDQMTVSVANYNG